MCAEYKEDKQNKLNAKFKNKSKDLPEFIRDYFEFMKSGDTKINTLISIRKFIEWLIENRILNKGISDLIPLDIQDITDVHITKYLKSLKDGSIERNIKPLKHTSVNVKMNQISGFWNYLTSKKYAEYNIVTDRVRDLFYLEDTHEIIVPTDEEIEELLNSISDIKNELVAIKYIAIVKLLIGSGIRLSELVGLDIDDLHFDEPDPYITVMGKGRQNVEREVPVSDTAIVAVNDYLRIRNLDGNIKDMKPLFVSTWGNRLSASTIQKEIKLHSNDYTHVHLLRHYTASKMYGNGAEIATVSKQLGHTNVNTAIKAYVKIDKSTTRNALNTIH